MLRISRKSRSSLTIQPLNLRVQLKLTVQLLSYRLYGVFCPKPNSATCTKQWTFEEVETMGYIRFCHGFELMDSQPPGAENRTSGGVEGVRDIILYSDLIELNHILSADHE